MLHQLDKKNWTITQHRLLFYGLWLLLSWLTAANSELMDDEAYYWVYSRYTDWGYFDHPPMIGLLIKAGYAIFPNEFGVRILITVMGATSVFLAETILRPQKLWLFYSIVLTAAVLQVGGFIAVPDAPQIFFTMLYLWVWKHFSNKSNGAYAIALGTAAALLLYSKYHGVLVIGLLAITTPSIWKTGWLYVAAFIGLLLFAPHLYWQYTHGFPSVQYHLKERSATPWQIGFTLEYIGGQIAFLSLFLGWLYLWMAIRFKPNTTFFNSVKWLGLGILGFFLLMSFKGRVEANWTGVALLPLLMVAYLALEQQVKWHRWVGGFALVTFMLVSFVRLYITTNNWPFTLPKDEFHNSAKWASQLKDSAAGQPVAFLGSYQQAAKYWFYSGQPAMAYHYLQARRTNYNIWPIEDSLLGKTVVCFSDKDWSWSAYEKPFETSKGKFAKTEWPNYTSFQRLRLTVSNGDVTIPLYGETSCKVTARGFEAYAPMPDSVLQQAHLVWLIMKGKESIAEWPTTIPLTSLVKGNHEVLVPLSAVDSTLAPGKYGLKLGISHRLPFATLNSSLHQLTLTQPGRFIIPQ